MKKRRRKCLFILIGLFGLFILLFQGEDSVQAKDPDYPTKPINIYIGFPPGGTTDVMTRAATAAATKHLGQPFVVINKIGGASTLAVKAVMDARPDGYNLGITSGAAPFIAPHSGECLYQDLSALRWIMNFSMDVHFVMVRNDSPWKTWEFQVPYCPCAIGRYPNRVNSTFARGNHLW